MKLATVTPVNMTQVHLRFLLVSDTLQKVLGRRLKPETSLGILVRSIRFLTLKTNDFFKFKKTLDSFQEEDLKGIKL